MPRSSIRGYSEKVLGRTLAELQVVWELSPRNTLLGSLIASLLGQNLSLSYLAVTQLKSCGLSASTGL
ncbi:hypothetical protein [Halovenus halobia]|uniref:hypothetical protein n=1 Tax=Halovenus halobia TaxID=3396622 RepID=UPI003F56EF4B